MKKTTITYFLTLALAVSPLISNTAFAQSSTINLQKISDFLDTRLGQVLGDSAADTVEAKTHTDVPNKSPLSLEQIRAKFQVLKASQKQPNSHNHSKDQKSPTNNLQKNVNLFCLINSILGNTEPPLNRRSTPEIPTPPISSLQKNVNTFCLDNYSAQSRSELPSAEKLHTK